MPHPDPIPVGGVNPTVSGHYYVGSVWGPKKATVDVYQISTQLRVPDQVGATAAGGQAEFYYVIMSAFDNNGSYDQIGLSDDYGVWGMTYSYTYDTAGTGCTGTLAYVYNPDTFNLNPGQWYTFGMIFYTNYPGDMSFYVFQGSALVYQLTVYTGGTAFVLQNNNCGYYGTTDYEEVYDTQQGVPDVDMHFVGGVYRWHRRDVAACRSVQHRQSVHGSRPELGGSGRDREPGDLDRLLRNVDGHHPHFRERRVGDDGPLVQCNRVSRSCPSLPPG